MLFGQRAQSFQMVVIRGFRCFGLDGYFGISKEKIDLESRGSPPVGQFDFRSAVGYIGTQFTEDKMLESFSE